MIAIVRSPGITASEKYLAKLADRTFLNLWSYPNLYIDKKEGGKGAGKELCDLLVVCGDDVFVFSDKSIEWPDAKDIGLAWTRWYRRAIDKSVSQIRGAQRWLSQFPERVFLDPACEHRLPIELPPVDRRRFHGIIIALGANRACANYFSEGSGTLMMVPHIKGAEHTNTDRPDFQPFTIGDVNPDGSFVHVFDDQALDLVMQELDTVADFKRYLVCRERIIRSGQLIVAPGEEELLGCYLLSSDKDGDHDFVQPDGKPIKADTHFGISEGMYENLIHRREYIAKKDADRPSYAWDRLIEKFTKNILRGTSVSVFGEVLSVSDAEQALRTMALESRVSRRMLGGALIAAMEQSEQQKAERFARVVFDAEEKADQIIAYVYLILGYPTKFELAGGYEQYRKVRLNTLHAYCLNVMSEDRHLKRVVGIALDASSKVTGRKGGSEDLIALEIPKWTPELDKQAAELKEQFDILSPERVRYSKISDQEYPSVRTVEPGAKLSRQQRRALERANRKAKRRRK